MSHNNPSAIFFKKTLRLTEKTYTKDFMVIRGCSHVVMRHGTSYPTICNEKANHNEDTNMESIDTGSKYIE